MLANVMVASLFLPKPMKNYIFLERKSQSGTEKLQAPLNNTKQAKGTPTNVPKRDACLVVDYN